MAMVAASDAASAGTGAPQARQNLLLSGTSVAQEGQRSIGGFGLELPRSAGIFVLAPGLRLVYHKVPKALNGIADRRGDYFNIGRYLTGSGMIDPCRNFAFSRL